MHRSSNTIETVDLPEALRSPGRKILQCRVIALVLSHLSVILQAYREGASEVLVLEEGAIVTEAFLDSWRAYAELAPSDWTVLQWTTPHLAVLEQSHVHVVDPWLSWLPDLTGMHAYHINRKGMAAILESFHETKTDEFTHEEVSVWKLPDDIDQLRAMAEDLFASYLISSDQRVYTSSHPWIVSEDILRGLERRGTIDPRGLSAAPVSLDIPVRNETLLAFRNARFLNAESVPGELRKMRLDVESVCGVHHYSSCDWILKFVVAYNETSEMLERGFEAAVEAAGFPSSVFIEISRSSEPFNKFGMLAGHLDKMGKYDLVLLVDEDQRLAGFPWASFLQRKGNALIAAPLRQTPQNSLVKGKMETLPGFQLYNAYNWKNQAPAPWDSFFPNASTLKVSILEMYLDVFDGKFAEWFFSRLLTEDYLATTRSNWGVDLLWCGAAKEFDPARSSCLLVPYVSVHEDTRKLQKTKVSFYEQGWMAIARLHESFEPWFETSEYLGMFSIRWSLLEISKMCLKGASGVEEGSDVGVESIESCFRSDLGDFALETLDELISRQLEEFSSSG